MTKPKAFYEGCLRVIGGHAHATDNVGDLACYLGARQLLDDHADVVLDELRRADFYILGGGTILRVCSNSTPSLGWRWPPTFVFGAGVELYGFPEHPPCAEFLLLLKRAVLLGVRGPLSKDFLDAYTSKARVIGDLALQLETAKPNSGRASNVVALNVGDTGGYLFGSEHELHKQAAALITALQASGYEVRTFAMWPSDFRMLERLPARSMEFTNDPHVLIDRLKDCAFVVGEKLHAAILALCAGTPFVSLAYRHKCLDFMASLDGTLSKWVVRTDDPDLAARVCGMIDSLAQQRPVIEASMADVRRDYVARQKAFVGEMMDLVRHRAGRR